MSNNSLPSVEVSITGDVTNLIDTSVTQPVGTVMTTLQSIWNLTFGKFDHWNDKVKIKREAELLMLRQDIFEKTSRIPEDFITEPKMSIVGPAIEASQYYFEESYYREMFSNLISSSMDSRVSNRVHPAFIEFIKQLTPDEARFLNNLKTNKTESFPIAKIMLEVIKDNSNATLPFTNKILLPDYLTNSITSNTNAILDNLLRLSIISYEFDIWFTNDKLYDYVLKTKLYIDKSSEYASSKTHKIEISKGICKLTELGSEFINIVL